MKIIIHLIYSLLLISHASCKEMREVKVTVTEEDGTAIQGARVQISFIGYTSEQSTRSIELTDENGRHQASGTAPLRMKVMVSKDGYYDSVRGGLSKQKDHDVTIVLRKIKNPIPLYAKRALFYIPKLNTECGYDFKEGDWVAPYGKGKKVMCYFKMEKNIISDKAYTQSLLITFPNLEDGIIPLKTTVDANRSKFKFLYNAPDIAYLPELLIKREKLPQMKLKNDGGDFNYVLKLNTVKNEKGEIVSNNYLRINRGLDLYGVLSDKPAFEFSYYYNPTPNDRNLEFAPTKSLFKDLDSTEVVREP